MANKKSSTQKSKRTLNQSTGQPKSRKNSGGAPFNDQDPKRRLGNYATAGEHARQGGRTSGIVGQTKQKNKTDK